MAMQVAGTMTLGDLIAQAKAKGASIEKAEREYWSDVYQGWYRPEYLVMGDRAVPLPTTNDHSVPVDGEYVDFVRSRLGLPPFSGGGVAS